MPKLSLVSFVTLTDLGDLLPGLCGEIYRTSSRNDAAIMLWKLKAFQGISTTSSTASAFVAEMIMTGKSCCLC